MTTRKLKPCPFCGCNKVVYRWRICSHYNGGLVSQVQIECIGCGIGGKLFDSEDIAARAWNRRAETAKGKK